MQQTIQLYTSRMKYLNLNIFLCSLGGIRGCFDTNTKYGRFITWELATRSVSLNPFWYVGCDSRKNLSELISWLSHLPCIYHFRRNIALPSWECKHCKIQLSKTAYRLSNSNFTILNLRKNEAIGSKPDKRFMDLTKNILWFQFCHAWYTWSIDIYSLNIFLKFFFVWSWSTLILL